MAAQQKSAAFFQRIHSSLTPSKVYHYLTMIKIVSGDITEFEGDALVNAANSALAPGGGVCGAIYEGAGFEELLEACVKVRPCPTGDARITPGFNLHTKYIIHAVGPNYYLEREPEAKLREVYRSIIRVARENGIKTIAVPSISTGIYGYPVQEAAPIALQELSKAPDLDITVYCFGFDVREAYDEAMETIRG